MQLITSTWLIPHKRQKIKRKAEGTKKCDSRCAEKRKHNKKKIWSGHSNHRGTTAGPWHPRHDLLWLCLAPFHIHSHIHSSRSFSSSSSSLCVPRKKREKMEECLAGSCHDFYYIFNIYIPTNPRRLLANNGSWVVVSRPPALRRWASALTLAPRLYPIISTSRPLSLSACVTKC